MKKFVVAAVLAAGLWTSADCLAALEYSFDQETKVFTVKSEELISLDEGANELKVAFVKRYNLGPDKKGRVPKIAKPQYGVEMYVEGSKRYEFADNANYWQEHNYTYQEMTWIKRLEAERAKIAKQQEADKAADEAARKANNGKKVELTQEEAAARKELAEYDKELAEQQALLTKTRYEMKRNASTLIYLQVENKLSKEDTSKKLYDFEDPVKLQKQAEAAKQAEEAAANKNKAAEIPVADVLPDAALDARYEEGGINPSEKNLMELELARQAEQKRLLEEQQDRERLAQLNVEDPAAAAVMREKILAREAEKKLAASDAAEQQINERIAQGSAHLEEVRATRAAFLKYQAEQKATMEGMAYTSTAKGKLSAGDNFFKKVQNSLEKEVPLFFEVKFWNGGANQRLWLQREKLQELQELLNYDLYSDPKHKDILK